jgi:hypothetical protein
MRLPFTLESSGKKKSKNTYIVDPDLTPPVNFSKMINFAEKVAELYSYVRVDFYEVNDRLYFGEITHHHGGGFDQLRPIEWDYKYGNILNLDYVSL